MPTRSKFDAVAANKRAAELVKGWTAEIHKLDHYRNVIEQVKKDFASKPRGTEICDCTSFRDFCRLKLNHTRQAVYAMLGSYTSKTSRRNRRYNKNRILSETVRTLVLNIIKVSMNEKNHPTFGDVFLMMLNMVKKDDDVVAYAQSYKDEYGKDWMVIPGGKLAKAAAA